MRVTEQFTLDSIAAYRTVSIVDTKEILWMPLGAR